MSNLRLLANHNGRQYSELVNGIICLNLNFLFLLRTRFRTEMWINIGDSAWRANTSVSSTLIPVFRTFISISRQFGFINSVGKTNFRYANYSCFRQVIDFSNPSYSPCCKNVCFSFLHVLRCCKAALLETTSKQQQH